MSLVHFLLLDIHTVFFCFFFVVVVVTKNTVIEIL